MTVTDIHVKMMVHFQKTVFYFVTNTLNLHKIATYVYTCAVVVSFDIKLTQDSYICLHMCCCCIF